MHGAHEETSPPGMEATAPQMCAILSSQKKRKERLGNNRKITHAGQELTEHENEKQVTEIALTALKNGKTSQNQQNANTSCEPAQHYQHSVKSRKTDVT